MSGGKLSRPILDKIMERIRNGESDGILVNNLFLPLGDSIVPSLATVAAWAAAVTMTRPP